MLTALEAIRKEAREAHAKQQYLIAEQHYRILLNKEANIDDVINLGALLRSQGRIKEGSNFTSGGSNILDKMKTYSSTHATAGMTTIKVIWY